MKYESMKVKELKDLMNQRDIPIYNHYKKQDLIMAIKMRDAIEEINKKPKKSKDRKLELRIAKIPIDLTDFAEPFDEIGMDNEYAVHNILTPILTEPEEDPGDFPNNIEEIYWGYVLGEEDEWGYAPYEGDWKLFCKLTNGNYAYFTASRCSCGFGMWPDQLKLYVAKSYEDIIKYAMTQSDYEMYMEDTEPIKEKSSCMKIEETIIITF